MPSVALIGSFRKHMQEIRQIRGLFLSEGIEVTTPQGDEIEDQDEEFVRFREEFEDEDDPTVQSIAMHRILRADATYVIAPEGYVGRTTCYEIGRIVQAARPLYFSQRPKDLPLYVPNGYIVGQDQLARMILGTEGQLSTLHAEGEERCSVLERGLLNGEFVRE